MFTLIDTTEFPKRRLTAKRFRHQCGLEVLSLEADDSENLFALCFNTPPSDNTGVAHIIEHSVLEGSRKYPVKDPFVCMLKGSVATFINAMTYSDRTIYPCCTCCPQDYFNLFSVYWDAVYHPNLTKATFQQEGWHYEIKGNAAHPRLKYNGIVLNEMSGYYSSPGTILGRAIEGGLFPDTPLRYDSGGAPAAIPSLTYAAFKRFHRRHYAPAVSRIVLYGNIPTEEKLAFIEKQLQETLPAYAGQQEAELSPSSRPRKLANEYAPRNGVVRRPFTPDPKSARTGRGICGIAWALDNTRNAETDLAFQLLEAVLLGNSASPLSKALLESRIGESPMASGYDNETSCTSFQVVMRGVKPAEFKKYEELVLEILRNIVREGLAPVQKTAAVAAFQVANQDISSRYVIGILEDICASWTYSDDPYGFLRLSEALPRINAMLAENPRFFEELIQKWLLDNPRRIRIELVPDTSLKKRQDDALQAKLDKRLSGWSPEKIRSIKANAEMLKKRAVLPDSPEAVATLPRLQRSDLPTLAPASPYLESAFANGLRFRRGNIFDNGIDYLTLAADASTLAPHLLPWVPFFAALFNQVGTASRTYDQLGAEYAKIGASSSIYFHAGYLDAAAEKINLLAYTTISSLDQNFGNAMALLAETIDSIAFSETPRIMQLLKSAAARAMASLQSRSNLSYCRARSLAGINPVGIWEETGKGINALRLICRAASFKGAELESFCNTMKEIALWFRSLPFTAAGFVGSDKALDLTADFTASRPVISAPGNFCAFTEMPADITANSGRREYLSVAAKVASCTRTIAAPGRTSPDSLPLHIIAKMLSVGYLWDEIRAKGGAYHANFTYNPVTRSAAMLSSEDPQAAATFKVFDSVRDYLLSNAFNPEEAAKAAMVHAGNFLQPPRPGNFHALLAASLISGRTDAERQADFARSLTITPEEIRQAGIRLLAPEKLIFNDCAVGPNPPVENFKAITL